LNPVRASIAEMNEASEFTSIYSRIRALRSTHNTTPTNTGIRADRLLPFRDHAPPGTPAISMTLKDYLELVDWSGRIVRADKRGAIDDQAPPILQRLNIDPDVWREALRIRGNVFGRALGRLDRLRLHARILGQARIKGLSQAQRLFRTA
jgi:hypothetical protein